MESRCRYGVQKDDVVDEVHHGDKLDTSVAAGWLTREDGSTCMLNIPGACHRPFVSAGPS